jgi:hypothetical protein
MVIFQVMAIKGSYFTNGHYSSPSVFNHSFLEFYLFFYHDMASTCFVHNTSYLLLPVKQSGSLCKSLEGCFKKNKTWVIFPKGICTRVAGGGVCSLLFLLPQLCNSVTI